MDSNNYDKSKLQYCNYMNKIELFNKSDVVWDYFVKNPCEEITPNELSKKLKINYNTVNSAINRYYISGKIQKIGRGVYMLKLPMIKGQKILSEMI